MVRSSVCPTLHKAYFLTDIPFAVSQFHASNFHAQLPRKNQKKEREKKDEMKPAITDLKGNKFHLLSVDFCCFYFEKKEIEKNKFRGFVFVIFIGEFLLLLGPI